MSNSTKSKRSRKGAAVEVSSNVQPGPVAQPQSTPPENTSTASKLAALREMLRTATVAARNVEIGQAALNKDRIGNYDAAMQIAVEAGDPVTFAAAWDGWKADISANKDGIAVACNCTASKPRKDGTVTYNLPSGLRTAVSVIQGAMAHGIKLTGKDGKPLSFGKVRDAKQAADAAKATAATVAALSPADAARHAVRELCAKVAAAADAMTVADCAETQKILTHVLAIATGEAGESKAAANG